MTKRKRLTVASTLLLVGYVTIGQLTIKPAVIAPKQPTAVVIDQSPNVDELYKLTNEDRAAAGLQPLERDPRLDASARDKCADMVMYNEHKHYLPNGYRISQYIEKYVSSTEFSYGTENLAWDYPTSTSVNGAWLDSPAHRAAILSPVITNVGYAVCANDGPDNRNFVVQHFTQPR